MWASTDRGWRAQSTFCICGQRASKQEVEDEWTRSASSYLAVPRCMSAQSGSSLVRLPSSAWGPYSSISLSDYRSPIRTSESTSSLRLPKARKRSPVLFELPSTPSRTSLSVRCRTWVAHVQSSSSLRVMSGFSSAGVTMT